MDLSGGGDLLAGADQKVALRALQAALLVALQLALEVVLQALHVVQVHSAPVLEALQLLHQRQPLSGQQLPRPAVLNVSPVHFCQRMPTATDDAPSVARHGLTRSVEQCPIHRGRCPQLRPA